MTVCKLEIKTTEWIRANCNFAANKWVSVESLQQWLEPKLVYPTNTQSVAVYDFIRELLGLLEQKEDLTTLSDGRSIGLKDKNEGEQNK